MRRVTTALIAVALAACSATGADSSTTVALTPAAPTGSDAPASPSPTTAERRVKHPGAAVVIDGVQATPLRDTGFIPSLSAAPNDRKANRPCAMGPAETGPLQSCTVGPADADVTIAVVGASHAGHWRAALDRVAPALDVRFVWYVRNACIVADPPLPDATAQCRRWIGDVIDEVIETRPDAVLTTITQVRARGSERVPPGAAGLWKRVARTGITVIGVRDTPRIPKEPLSCVERHGASAKRCRGPASLSQAPRSPALSAGIPGLVHIDPSPWVCPNGTCRPVVGNVLVFRDNAHLTDTYARTTANGWIRALRPVVDDLR